MRKLNVFLSSEMTGELDRERDGIRIFFMTDSILKEFFELYAIEEHASPQPIEKAYINEVKNSDLEEKCGVRSCNHAFCLAGHFNVRRI